VRAFLALPLPAPLQEALARRAAALEGLRAQRPGTIHLTVRFLGDLEDPEPVLEAVRPVAAATPPFELELTGLGAFPGPRRARVVWVGVGRGAEEAAALAAGVDRALEALGIPPEDRPWSAHVTLGRYRQPRALPTDAAQAPDVWEPAPARELVLFSSTLTPRGAVHEAVGRLPLGGAG